MTLLRFTDPNVGSFKVETLQFHVTFSNNFQCLHMNVMAVPEHRRHQAVLWLLGILSSIQGEGTAVVLQNPVDPNQNPEGLPSSNGAGTDCS